MREEDNICIYPSFSDYHPVKMTLLDIQLFGLNQTESMQLSSGMALMPYVIFGILTH